MFDSLFKVKFNWPLYLLAGFAIRLVFIDMSWWSYSAIMITLFQFGLLFSAIGHIIPIRYLLGSFMCLQFLVGATFAYNGADQYQYIYYKMRIPEAEYFSYVLPAVVLFILGLNVLASRLPGETVNRESIRVFAKNHPQMAYIFIAIGFLSSIVSIFFSSDLAFVFYLLGGFKFVGLFLLLLGDTQLKPVIMTIVIGSIISSSMGSGMFHDLLTWLIFAAAVLGIKYRFGLKIKLLGLIGFVLMVFTIQVLKGSYRQMLAASEGGIAEFAELASEENKVSGGLFSLERLAQHNVRINQGFIITNIMNTVPTKVPFENGRELMLLLEAGIMPRILAPNKLKAGDRDIFFKYSGIALMEGTSMGLSSVGDAYINFGIVGGWVFMFFYGVLFNVILYLFGKNSRRYPILILFTTLVFYYPIRPDCELQTILGHLFKSCFLIYAILLVWKHEFSITAAKVKKHQVLSKPIRN